MEEEIWLPIAGFPDYEVSNRGRVRSSNPNGMKPRSPEGVLKPWLHKAGYPMVALYAETKSFKRTIHSLVCEAFHGPAPSPKHEVAHYDGKPWNVWADNLRWALPTENHADKRRHGTHFNSGQFVGKLTDNDIREIRRLLATGMSQSRIAARFGIWQTMVSHIKVGRRFADIK